MYQCEDCRTSFVDPVPSHDALADFYKRYHLPTSEGGGYAIAEVRRGEDIAAMLRMVRRYACRDGSRVLDVGCGKGFFVKACRDAGLDAHGIDLSSSAIEYATRELAVSAVAGALADRKSQLGTFDAVTLWATIEHLAEPRQMLADIHTVLRPGGRLFLDTGIGDDWLDRCLPGKVSWYDPPQHLFVFSKDGMGRVLAQAGFRVVHLDTNYERSVARRAAKTLRNSVCAVGLRLVSSAARLKSGPFEITRYALGNAMVAVAERPD